MSNLSKNEVIAHVCATVSMAYHGIGNYDYPSDGFCQFCPGASKDWEFRHKGETLEFVRRAVAEKLLRDGHKIPEGYDPETLEELTPPTVLRSPAEGEE